MNRKTFLQWTVLSAGLPLLGASRAASDPLRIGLTAVILTDQAAFLSRWSEYLVRGLATPVTFVVRDSYQSILDLLFANQLEAAWICGYPYTLHQRQLQLIAVPLYQGKPLYQSYLIKSSRPELEVRGWPDVRGKVMAYSDPLSNSGWLVAQTQLHAVGLSQRDLKKTFFAHGHRNVAEAVAAQLADVGPIDGYVWETMKAQRMPAVDQAEIVWKSEVFGFPPIVAPASARNPRIQSLQASLLEMHKDPDGRRLLDALNLTGFEAGSPSLFDSIARMSAALQARTR